MRLLSLKPTPRATPKLLRSRNKINTTPTIPKQEEGEIGQMCWRLITQTSGSADICAQMEQPYLQVILQGMVPAQPWMTLELIYPASARIGSRNYQPKPTQSKTGTITCSAGEQTLLLWMTSALWPSKSGLAPGLKLTNSGSSRDSRKKSSWGHTFCNITASIMIPSPRLYPRRVPPGGTPALWTLWRTSPWPHSPPRSSELCW